MAFLHQHLLLQEAQAYLWLLILEIKDNDEDIHSFKLTFKQIAIRHHLGHPFGSSSQLDLKTKC